MKGLAKKWFRFWIYFIFETSLACFFPEGSNPIIDCKKWLLSSVTLWRHLPQSISVFHPPLQTCTFSTDCCAECKPQNLHLTFMCRAIFLESPKIPYENPTPREWGPPRSDLVSEKRSFFRPLRPVVRRKGRISSLTAKVQLLSSSPICTAAAVVAAA